MTHEGEGSEKEFLNWVCFTKSLIRTVIKALLYEEGGVRMSRHDHMPADDPAVKKGSTPMLVRRNGAVIVEAPFDHESEVPDQVRGINHVTGEWLGIVPTN